MLIQTIEDIKGFVNKLLTAPEFDEMCMYAAEIKNASFIQIDGRLNKEFFDTEDEVKNREFLLWSEIKGVFFQGIRGKRLPLVFKITLMPQKSEVERIINENNLSVNSSDISALNLNIYYDRGVLSVTSGTSLKIFTLDKTLDFAWEEEVKKILKKLEIV